MTALSLALYKFKKMTENAEFYIRYRDNQPVPIDISYGRGLDKKKPLETVAHLIEAYKKAVLPLLDGSSLAQLSLHLPDDLDISTLDKDFVAINVTNNTLLDPGTLLSSLALHTLGTKSKEPLVIKSKLDSVGKIQGINFGLNPYHLAINPLNQVSGSFASLSINDPNRLKVVTSDLLSRKQLNNSNTDFVSGELAEIKSNEAFNSYIDNANHFAQPKNKPANASVSNIINILLEITSKPLTNSYTPPFLFLEGIFNLIER